MKVGPSHAAKMAGIARSKIYKDIENGKVSAEKDDRDRYQIDVSELERAYGTLKALDDEETSEETPPGQSGTQEKDSADSLLKQEIEHLRELLAAKDKRIEDKEDVIADLRARLDRAEEDRRSAHTVMTGLLTDQRDRNAKEDTKHEPRAESGGFLKKLLGG